MVFRFRGRRRKRGRISSISAASPRTKRAVRSRRTQPRKRPRIIQARSVFQRARLTRALRRRKYTLRARTNIVFGALRALRVRRRRT